MIPRAYWLKENEGKGVTKEEEARKYVGGGEAEEKDQGERTICVDQREESSSVQRSRKGR